MNNRLTYVAAAVFIMVGASGCQGVNEGEALETDPSLNGSDQEPYEDSRPIDDSPRYQNIWYGNYVIQTVNDIDRISGFDFITDRLTIRGSELESLEGLEDLRAVGALHILGNPRLVDLDGLESLSEIRGDLWIEENQRLQNLDGLGSLERVAGTLNLNGNSRLSDVDGLLSLDRVGSDFTVRHNDRLESLEGLADLEWVGMILTIQGNDALETLGLHELDYVGTMVKIFDNHSLSSCEAEHFRGQLIANEGFDGEIRISLAPLAERCSVEIATQSTGSPL